MLKSYKELRKIDVTEYCSKRDGILYLNWAKCVDLLHENGAEKVYFEPVINEITGSSLFMTDRLFTDKNGVTNQCYEVEVLVTVDSDTWRFRAPLMNGSNPVKDNSMSQQRIWNCQTRAFVKCIAIHTGLGFDLWQKEEDALGKSADEDLSKHKLMKCKERMQLLVTEKMKKGMDYYEMAEKLGCTKDELVAYFTYYDMLERLEKRIREL